MYGMKCEWIEWDKDRLTCMISCTKRMRHEYGVRTCTWPIPMCMYLLCVAFIEPVALRSTTYVTNVCFIHSFHSNKCSFRSSSISFSWRSKIHNIQPGWMMMWRIYLHIPMHIERRPDWFVFELDFSSFITFAALRRAKIVVVKHIAYIEMKNFNDLD